jgi:G:T-mismatch repair DNA endonuclease (very short patch repair protein)
MPRKRKYTVESIRSILAEYEYILLSSEVYNKDKKILVRCKNKHENRIYISNFVKHGHRCIDCSGGRKYTIEGVKTAVELEGYTLLSEVYKRANDKLALICPSGHTYKVTWAKFNIRGDRCSTCSGNRTLTIQDAEERFSDAGYKLLSNEYTYCVDPLEFECDKGHSHSMSLNNLRKGQGCGACYVEENTSKSELHLRECLINVGTKAIYNDRKEIKPYELDIYFPEKKVAVEYCGLYWHSESAGKSKRYHYDKMIKCRERGIRLITVFEDEFIEREQVVVSRIKNALGECSRKVFARKCSVSVLQSKTAREFLKKYHLQGPSPSKFYIGLFFKEELVGVMSGGVLTRKHVTSKNTIELKRMAFLPGISVVGGASKMFKLFMAEATNLGAQEIRSYCDMRYGNYSNAVYTKLGFVLAYETKTTPHYVRHQKRYRNYSLRKTPEERETGKTEYELRLRQGYHRIWDCGHRTYIKEIKCQKN